MAGRTPKGRANLKVPLSTSAISPLFNRLKCRFRKRCRNKKAADAQCSNDDHTANSISKSEKPIVVLKLGTSTLMEADTHEVCVSVLNRFVDVVCSLKAQGFEVNIFALISHKKNFIELTMFDVLLLCNS